MSSFDELVKVALDEASLGDYIRAAGRVAGGAAKVAGSTLKVAGKAYAAIGGTQGGAALGKVGAAVSGAGKKLQDVSKPKLSSDKVIADLQDKKLLPLVGEYISTVVPGQKTITRLQVTDVESSNLSAVKDKQNDVTGKSKEQTEKLSGSVVVTAKPVDVNKLFDTVVVNFRDINNPLKNTVTAKFYKDNGITRIPDLSAIVTRKDHDPMFGSQVSWQFNNTSVQRKKQGKANQQSKNQSPAPTTQAAPQQTRRVVNRSTQTKAGTPVATPTSAQVRSMNLPTHPLTSNTPPNRP